MVRPVKPDVPQKSEYAMIPKSSKVFFDHVYLEVKDAKGISRKVVVSIEHLVGIILMAMFTVTAIAPRTLYNVVLLVENTRIRRNIEKSKADNPLGFIGRIRERRHSLSGAV